MKHIYKLQGMTLNDCHSQVEGLIYAQMTIINYLTNK
ncbi:hypothetical protein IMCC3317_19310 [Kordia antarctica]|uniref:Uncharacterized protein n=1 Tax=Kordia antarctica TaxID=1218801 RepID=A0A7L4ZIK1_9FLAO|nr:hypothetical protein IMCC3317_19310 [Kordia antarctica]